MCRVVIYRSTQNAKTCVSFIMMGVLMSVPSGFFFYKIYRAARAADVDERDKVLSEIPQ